MDVKYQRDMNRNYMVVLCEDALQEESYETRMIFANEIPGLLPCHTRYIDGRTYLGYDVTSRQGLPIFCENRRPGSREIRNIFGSILGIIMNLEEYLLCPDHLILDPEFILLNFDTQEAELAFAPFYTKDIRTSLREVVEYLLSFTAHDDRLGIVLGYRLSHELLEGNTGISQLMDILYERNERDEKDRPFGEAAGTERPGEKDKAIGTGDCFRETYEPGNIERTEYEQERKRETVSDLLVSGKERSGPEKERSKRRKKKAVKRVLPVLLAGSAAVAAYTAIRHFPVLFPGYGDLPVRIGIAVLICAAALYAGFRIRKGKRKEDGQRSCGMSEDSFGYFEDLQGDMTGLDDRDEVRPVPAAENEYAVGHTPDTSYRGEGITTLLTGKDADTAGGDVLVPEDPAADFPVIVLTSGEMLIGKQEKLVSQVIDSPAVSRIHARVRKGEGGYYLRDLNSTNGTSVNGKAVFGDDEVLISEGDRIMFADIVYIMKNASGM